MFEANEDYLKLPGSYLFSTVAKKAAAYQKAHPEAKIIRMGIGDVTQPLPPAVIKALHRAVDEMADAETFRGYAPDLGYDFLRKAMAENDYRARGCDIADDEIFISDGAKSDSGNIQEIFQRDNVLAVCDPVYPVYVDSNVMAGRTGTYDEKTTRWSNVIYMPCTEENGFAPDFPEKTPDFIYLCSPNNPTGTALTKDQLQGWVDYANRNGAVIIFDAAYEAYIHDGGKDLRNRDPLVLQERGLYRPSPRRNGHPEGSGGPQQNPALEPLGKASWHKVQRRALHRAESRRGLLHGRGKAGDPGHGRQIHAQRFLHPQEPPRHGLCSLRRREFPLHLAEDPGQHDLLGVL